MFISLNIATLCMVFIVGLTNYLVLFPINDWLTWGAFPYPFSFLITELTNRFYGPKNARKIVYVGFILGILISSQLATPKIAFASASAFLIAQLCDIMVFSTFRKRSNWTAPLYASTLASAIDSTIFWTLAFRGEDLPILTWALGDFTVKLLMDFALLPIYLGGLRVISRYRQNHLRSAEP